MLLPGCHPAISLVASPHHTSPPPLPFPLPPLPLPLLLPLLPPLPLLALVNEKTGAPTTSERCTATSGFSKSGYGGWGGELAGGGFRGAGLENVLHGGMPGGLNKKNKSMCKERCQGEAC